MLQIIRTRLNKSAEFEEALVGEPAVLDLCSSSVAIIIYVIALVL